MTPVIRIDEEVWKQLQRRAKPLIDTPNDVLRRIFELDKSQPQELKNEVTTENVQAISNMEDSIFIVVNAAGQIANEKNAVDGYRLTKRRVESGVDILAPRRFASARKLKRGYMIGMHQGGAITFRRKYGAGQLVAAGRVKEVTRELTENDKVVYREDYELTQECFPGWPLVGIIFYDFPHGMAKQPLPKEEVPYYPGRGDNFKEIRADDRRYGKLYDFWKTNY